MRFKGWLKLGAALLAAGAGCVDADLGQSGVGDPGARGDTVIGGEPESGYPAVGYLLYGGEEQCGVTIIAPRIAVTAAHCTHGFVLDGMGFGALHSGPLVGIKSVIEHPQFTGWVTAETVGIHDMAVLVLDQPVAVTPMQIGTAQRDAIARYVGYGQTSQGDPNAASAGARKSTQEQILDVRSGTIDVRGVNGGLCWGDSGGPLLEDGGNRVYGVLSGFSHEPYSCQIADELSFTSLDGEREFVEHAIACQDALDPAACAQVPSNQPPTLVITSPADGSPVNGVIQVAADAADADGAVVQVAFNLPDGTRVADATAPYAIEWDAASSLPGSHELTAVAVDDRGATSDVAHIQVVVGGHWAAVATHATDTVDDGEVCDTVEVTTTGDAGVAKLDIKVAHDYRAALSVTLEHGGFLRTIAAVGQLPAEAGWFELHDEPVAGFRGDAAGPWKLCVRDNDAYGDSGVISSWGVHD